MARPFLIALTAALTLGPGLGLPAAAQGVYVSPPGTVVNPQPLTGKRLSVARELRVYGFGDANVAALSNRQTVLLDNTMHSGRSNGDKGARIRSILRGGGILQRGIDRLGRGG